MTVSWAGDVDACRRHPYRLRAQLVRGNAALTVLSNLPDVFGGGMHVNAARLWSLLLGVQNAAGIVGDVCEVGVFRGYGSLLPAMLKSESEACWLVDISDHFLGEASKLLEAAGGVDPEAIRPVHGESGDFRRLHLLEPNGRKIRWAHIDGEHSREAVLRDLDNVASQLSRDAVVVIDDFSHPLAPSIRVAVHEWLRLNPTMRLLVEGYNKAYLVSWESALPWDAVTERLPELFVRYFSQRIMLASQTPSDQTPYWAYGDPINEDAYLRVGGTAPDWPSLTGHDAPSVLLGERVPPEFMIFGNCQMRVLAGALNAMASDLGMHARFMYVQDVQDLTPEEAVGIRDAMPNCVGLITQPVGNPRYLVSSTELEQALGGELSILVPSMHMSGYWPNQADLRLSSQSNASQPTDGLLYSAVAAGWNFEYVSELLGSAEIYSQEQVEGWWDASLQRLEARRQADGLHVDLAASIRKLVSVAPASRFFYTFNHPRKEVFDDVLRQVLMYLAQWFACREEAKLEAVLTGSRVIDFPMSSIDFLDIPPLPAVSAGLHLAEYWQSSAVSYVRPRGSGGVHKAQSLQVGFDGLLAAYSRLDDATKAFNRDQIGNSVLLPPPFAESWTISSDQ